MMELTGKTIGFALTGSFCTFKSAVEQIGVLVTLGADVVPILSFNAATIDTRFGMAADFASKIEHMTGHEAITTIAGAEPIGPKDPLDAIVVAPCTGNTLGKLAGGITDTPVTMAVKASLRNEKPVVVAVSTNDGLGASAQNIGVLLNAKHYFFVPFRQDAPFDKHNSLVADMTKIPDTLKLALDGIQIQPVITALP